MHISVKGLVSIVIPARNEPYLKKTIQDLLNKATGPIEVIAVLDGYWPEYTDIVEDDRVVYLHFAQAHGMRGGINAAVDISKGEFILKSDAHCMFEKGFDEVLRKDCKENWVVVPRRFALDPEKWEVIPNPKYPIDYMYLSSDLHGMPWTEKNQDISLKEKKIDDLMSAQGSCWFMRKTYYEFLELLDEKAYGTFYNEFQEIGLKAWLSGGEVKVNKNTWYAHWHKTEGRGYSLSKDEQVKAQDETAKWLDVWGDNNKAWHKQIYSIEWLIAKFAPFPGWEFQGAL